MASTVRLKGANIKLHITDDQGNNYHGTPDVWLYADTFDYTSNLVTTKNQDLGAGFPDIEVQEDGVTVTITGDQVAEGFVLLAKRRNDALRRGVAAPKIHCTLTTGAGGSTHTRVFTGGGVTGDNFKSGTRTTNAKGQVTIEFARMD